ncbi:MAG: mercuric reductase [Pseudomonadota bacterium]|jgi:pyruvate/2-oxoglutarate dehydrogenase complex dihydrolipoamide dehydrogenase (E3) component
MSREPRVTPPDEYNTLLEKNVHPPDWVNPEPASRYNLVVIGAGTAGLVTAAGAAGLGARVALVEKNLMGGDCLNVGCVPSKCLIRSGRAAADVRDAGDFGVDVAGGYKVDFGKVMERLRKLRAVISVNDSAKRFSEELGVDVFLGQASFTGSGSVRVDGRELRFKKAAITSGARAFELPIEGLAKAGFLTNETVFSLTQRPTRLAVIGAGPLGCELAQTFQRLGSAVSLIEMSPQVLSREDPDAARMVETSMLKDGVDLLLSCDIRKVEKKGEEKVISLVSGPEKRQLTVDEILIGVGRVPNVEGLSLESAGVQYDKRTGVKVDEHLRTSNPRIYAAGDICFPFKFTHTADAMARIVIQNALFGGRKKTSALTIPWCTYTDPEIAHVGMYESDAVRSGVPVDTFTIPMSEVDRAIAEGDTGGMVRIHVKKGSDRILGATIVARHAGEMISEISVAMKSKLGLGAISGVIHPYPTQAEAIRKAADAYNRTKLTPGVKKIFGAWLKWKRRG